MSFTGMNLGWSTAWEALQELGSYAEHYKQDEASLMARVYLWHSHPQALQQVWTPAAFPPATPRTWSI